jgi:nucleoside-diphosphate-sugar epimerase
MSMIAMVTGAGGFIGSHLVEALLSKGYEVRCVDTCRIHHGAESNPDVDYHMIDCTDSEALSHYKICENVDVVFHLAGVTKALNLESFQRHNVRPTKNLLELLKEKSGRLRRFVFVSSQAAAGPAPDLDHPSTETDKPNPIEEYGKSKYEAECVVNQYGMHLPCTILRPSSVYGPRDVDFLQIFKHIRHHVSFYPGYRDHFASMIFISDLVDGILQASETQKAVGQTYFLSTDEMITWQQIHQTIQRVQDQRAMEVNVPRPIVDLVCKLGDAIMKWTGHRTIINSQKAALAKSPYWICSSEKALRDFGFKPRVLLDEGMRITYHWYKENGWIK